MKQYKTYYVRLFVSLCVNCPKHSQWPSEVFPFLVIDPCCSLLYGPNCEVKSQTGFGQIDWVLGGITFYVYHYWYKL